jgi:hypothetical protein
LAYFAKCCLSFTKSEHEKRSVPWSSFDLQPDLVNLETVDNHQSIHYAVNNSSRESKGPTQPTEAWVTPPQVKDDGLPDNQTAILSK